MALLEIRNLSKNFGGLAAVSDLDLDVEEGEIRGIIGPNGAGKTTLFNVISGTYRPSGGTIKLEGKSIAGKRPSTIAAMGAVRTFQHTALFEDFDTMGNVSIARHLHAKETIFGAILGTAQFEDDGEQGHSDQRSPECRGAADHHPDDEIDHLIDIEVVRVDRAQAVGDQGTCDTGEERADHEGEGAIARNVHPHAFGQHIVGVDRLPGIADARAIEPPHDEDRDHHEGHAGEIVVHQAEQLQPKQSDPSSLIPLLG